MTDPDPANLSVLVTDDFVELFRMHYPRLVRALVLAGCGAGAEDVAQEAFARTFGHWRRVRRGPNPAGYVYRVAFRLLRRRGLIAPSPLDDANGPGLAVAGPETSAATNVDLERVLVSMPPRRRACAVLCLCLELSPPEAADVLAIAPGTVRKQLDLARASLLAGLADTSG